MLINFIKKVFESFLENRILSRWFVLLIDIFIIICATASSYSITLQIYKNLKVLTHPSLIEFLVITLSINILFFIIFKTYKGIVRYSTIHEFQRILIALLLSGFFIFVVLYKFIGPSGSVAVAYCSTLFLMSIIGLLGFRIIVVFLYQKLVQTFSAHPPIPVFVWGITEDNLAFAQTLNSTKSKYQIKGFINTDTSSRSKLKDIANLPVVRLNNIRNLSKYNIAGILFTDESSIKKHEKLIGDMLDINIHVYVTQQKDINSYSELTEAAHQIRPIQIEDLLGRPEINISMDKISENVKDKIVLVTGAAGSIGSEIVRQLANFEPKQIICLDQAETPLNDLHIELEKKYSHLNFISIIGDVRNKSRISKVFKEYKPDIVYHAAAYKHVPLMEKDPCEAIVTNVMGTKILVDLSIQFGVEMFVMVSTDKAVNPTNIMGASKRIAEIYVQSSAMDSRQNTSNTKFVTTRFGNVLGSNGSVIPLFRKQIEKGGPITVTHPDIIRYFMTIPEACRLVLEASVIGQSGYIYVFDMGKPVKILDLATRMIELAGLKLGEDIQIEFSGLRPGEKLYEELLANTETTQMTTSHEKVMIAKVREYKYNEILLQIENIIESAKSEDKYRMVSLMKQLVPEYISKNSEFESLDHNNNKKVINKVANIS